MKDKDRGPSARASRALSVSRKLLIVGGIVVIVTSGNCFAIVGDAIQASDAPAALDSPALPHLIPRPTGLENRTVKPAEQMLLRTETLTDGYIAIAEDLTTPVFCHFSGRVSKFIAEMGDRVQKGSPLMGVE